MVRLIVSRLVGGLFVLFVVATVSFFLLRAAPGGPFASERAVPDAVQRNIEERYHLDDPLWQQYTDHMSRMARLDFGHSMKRQRTVNEMIAKHSPHSLQLGLMAIVFATLFGTALGVTAAAKRNRWPDYVLMIIALLGISVPSFVLGPIFIRFFSLNLGWFPPARAESFVGYVLPSLVLGMIYAGTVARLARAGVLETLGQDYVRTARAKGLPERTVVVKHALRSTLTPILTIFGLDLGVLMGGAVLTETAFSLPGLGAYAIQAIARNDLPKLLGVTLVIAFFVVLANLVVDILYAVVDPRVRLG